LREGDALTIRHDAEEITLNRMVPAVVRPTLQHFEKAA
jgi:hypothetical protein